ncbi:MAG: peptidase M23 [Methylotenera sp.]|nr:peptidase M23 [Methylotenera sp.]MSP99440.1 peptidase M23 [Methylotenera sp.]
MNHTYFKHHSTCTALLVLLLALAPLAHATKPSDQSKQSSKESLSDVQQKLESLRKELNNSQEAHKDAADALKESEVAISKANKNIFDINHKQQENKEILVKLASDSMTTNLALGDQQKLLGNQLYQQYIHGQQSYVQIILQNEHPSTIARDVQYFSYIAKARTELINKMQDNLRKISKLNDETTLALKEVVELKRKKIDERLILQSQNRAKSKVVRTLSQQIAMQRGEIKKLSRDEKRLSQLVERLARIVLPSVKKSPTPRDNSSKTNQTESAKNTQAVKESVNKLSNNVEPNAETGSGKFSMLKGKLRLPVRGDVRNRFGSSREDSGISWKGLFIRASEGAEVKSVATGRVVFADWLRGFGNLIILDHGDGYMSLYGNNQAVLKQVGDNVHAGDAIASVGNSGGNETSGLYYELRRQSRPFDPLSWSKLN